MSVKSLNLNLFRIGCINSALSILIASAGGHNPWDEERKRLFSLANNHHMFSSFGILAASLRSKTIPVILFLVGSGLFSGILYYRCFENNRSMNYLMPIGGVSNILGWMLLIV